MDTASGVKYTNGVQHYNIKLKEKWTTLPESGGDWANLIFKGNNGGNPANKITSIRLRQENDGGISFFYGLQVYNGFPVEVQERGATSLTFHVDFSNIPTFEAGKFFYLPYVKVIKFLGCAEMAFHQVSFIHTGAR